MNTNFHEIVQEIRENEEKLKLAHRKWYDEVERLLAKCFPNPVTIKVSGRKEREQTGMLVFEKVSFTWYGEIRLKPFKKDGSLAKNCIGFPCVWHGAISRAKTEEEFVKLVREEMGIVEK